MIDLIGRIRQTGQIRKKTIYSSRLALLRFLPVILCLVSVLMLPSLIMAVVLGEHDMVRIFLLPPVIAAALALPVFFLFRDVRQGIRARDGFLLVFMTWVLATLTGSLPYYFSSAEMSFIDAVFESACGFATTGATTFPDVEALPRSLLLWRSINHWAGGMGIILFTVALLPLLGVGGFQLVKAETPGPEKEKITPRIAGTAKTLWSMYCGFTALLVLLYRLGGMEWFDAVCHACTVMATGGVSTKNEGFGFYDSAYIDAVTVGFMFLGAINFNIYYRLARRKFRDIARNTEINVFLGIFVVAVLAVTASLVPMYGSVGRALRFGAFQTASILTTTGHVRVDYTAWPGLAQGVLFCLMAVGGCSGSTAGGIKVIRHTVLFKQMGNELRRALFPQGVFSIQLNRKIRRKDVVYSVAAYVFLYMLLVAFTTLATAAAGFDVFSSFCTALSITGNIGVGFGASGPFHSYNVFPDYLKLLYSLVMIAGRLELWTVLVLFTPGYWKR